LHNEDCENKLIGTGHQRAFSPWTMFMINLNMNSNLTQVIQSTLWRTFVASRRRMVTTSSPDAFGIGHPTLYFWL